MSVKMARPWSCRSNVEGSVNRLFAVALGLCLAVPASAQRIPLVKSHAQDSTSSAASIGGILYADRCAGSDIGAKINSCVALLPVTTKEFQSGYKAGTIILPNTVSEPDMDQWATPVVLGPGVNLEGQGLFASYFHCTVNGDCLQHNAGGNGTNTHTVVPNTVWSGFTIAGSNIPHQIVIHLVDTTNMALRDIAADGASNATGTCIELSNVKSFTERNEFLNVSSLYNCNVGWRFTSSSSNPFQPHPSFGYNRFLDIKANPNKNQTAVSVEGNSTIYNSTINMTVNGPDTRSGTIYWHEQEGAEVYQSDVHLYGEGEFEKAIDLTSSSNQFIYSGQIFVGPQPNYITSGAIFENLVDNGSSVPNNPAVSYAAVAAITPRPLSAGADLNNLNACGYFGGSGILHTPAAIGTDFVKVQVICSSNNSYVTQIAYLMAHSTLQQQRTWQRMNDNGAWGTWRELVWADQMPLIGYTNDLPMTPIGSNSCANLTASIPGVTAGMGLLVTLSHDRSIGVGLQWNTSFVSSPGTVAVPICNSTGSSITPLFRAKFKVQAIQ